MIGREKILQDLISFNKPLGELVKMVESLAWDYEGEPVIITPSHISNVLDRFLKEELIDREVEDWANLIECREDLSFELDYSENLSEVIHQLANPVLEGELTSDKCRRMYEKLSK